ncbi:F-box/LRR-repeat protein [Corchorus olitorius]|uniref:F-box/LRR-repeat protein n=1 Tax=Corchorus olitorius TaxID=93759 RepID=A0A1R3HGR3_9ROSI|nr:F-box/LRR-repeat protein [Corchorus olitorius]
MDYVTNGSSKYQIPEHDDDFGRGKNMDYVDRINIPNSGTSMSQIPGQDDDYGDRISELPDDILLQILSYLPITKDITTTCVLSTRSEPIITWDSVQRTIEEIPDRARIGKFRLHCDASVGLSAATKKRTEFIVV